MKKTTINLINKLKENGETIDTIAETLNKKGHATVRGKTWNRGNLNQFLARSKSSTAIKSIKPRKQTIPETDLIKTILNAEILTQDKKIDMIKMLCNK